MFETVYGCGLRRCFVSGCLLFVFLRQNTKGLMSAKKQKRQSDGFLLHRPKTVAKYVHIGRERKVLTDENVDTASGREGRFFRGSNDYWFDSRRDHSNIPTDSGLFNLRFFTDKYLCV